MLVSHENLALKKPASQSTTKCRVNEDCRREAFRAVDGNRDGVMTHGSCSHTEPEHNAWWKVDLGQQLLVREVIIYRRLDYDKKDQHCKN